ncbi:MAG: nucleotidyltransferase family protein [Pseudomonadota bacterium]|nr:nucleotidyltransferase family protein [Pseudomonadota bacterium]
MGESPYHVHRLALRPFTAVDRARWEGELARLLADRGEGPFIDFIVQQGLAPLWHGLFPKGTGPFSAKGAATLRAEAIRAAQIYLLQKAALGEITGILDGQGIEHLIFKGAHLREILYPEPHTRTACDIDLLVNPEDSGAAIRALLEAGYGLEVSPVSISHEATLLREQIGIDIHWDILRPGRTRRPMTGEIIARRQWAGDHWGPCAEHSLFVMLVHPVITKYATSPQATLNRLVDILLFMDKVGVEWNGVLARLAESGLKTAAWIMVEWLRILTAVAPPEDFVRAIMPGPLRRRYLGHWVAANYSTRLLRHHTLIRAGFTLPLHDTLGDGLRATRALYRERQLAPARLQALRWASPTIR